MKVEFRGKTVLANTLATAAVRRGFTIVPDADLVFVAAHVEDHDELQTVSDLMHRTIQEVPLHVPIVVTSQVPPGWTRSWADRRGNIFYQPHTIIQGHEDECAYAPDVTVIGCAEPDMPLPAAYFQYAEAFEAPILTMSYESAELSKLALNYILAAEIRAANELVVAAASVGANWTDIMPAVLLDKRIGLHAYIRPGVIGGHLPRDIRTVERLRMLQ